MPPSNCRRSARCTSPCIRISPTPCARLSPPTRASLRNSAPQRVQTHDDGLVILDRFRPETRPQGASLWIDPPADRSPVPIKERVEKPEGLRWVPDLQLTEGLRARNTQIESASVFEAGPGETKVAEIDKGAVMVARGNMVVIGFNPFAGSMRYELAAPLLLANILRWSAPDVFRDVDVGTQSAGAVSSPLAVGFDRRRSGPRRFRQILPFNIRDRAVQFFAGDPSRVRVIAGNSERVYSLTLPEMWDVKWNPPATARHGIPAWNDSMRRSRSLWPWLALTGGWPAAYRVDPLRQLHDLPDPHREGPLMTRQGRTGGSACLLSLVLLTLRILAARKDSAATCRRRFRLRWLTSFVLLTLRILVARQGFRMWSRRFRLLAGPQGPVCSGLRLRCYVGQGFCPAAGLPPGVAGNADAPGKTTPTRHFRPLSMDLQSTNLNVNRAALWARGFRPAAGLPPSVSVPPTSP